MVLNITPDDSSLSVDEKFRDSLVTRKYESFSKRVSPDNLGFPGYLTSHQNNALDMLRKRLEHSSADVQATVFPYPDIDEDSSYALCRWLRVCQFDVNKTMKKIEEASQYSAIPRQNRFYLDQDEALGVERSVYLQQFPQIYHGKSKNGAPIMISQLGKLNNKGAECVTTVEKVINFHWSEMTHTFGKQLKKYSEDGSWSQRCELVLILDLDGLTSSHLTKKIMHIIKTQCFIDELCFPESLHRMICINAPTFFTLVWKMIKGWIDPRNTTKVELYGTNKQDWLRRLHELIDKDELPSDYGGSCMSVKELLQRRMRDDYKKKQHTHQVIQTQETVILNVNGAASHQIIVKEKRTVRLSLWTNTKVNARIMIKDENGPLDSIPITGIDLKCEINITKHDATMPRKYNLDDHNVSLNGPRTFDLIVTTDGLKKCTFLLVKDEFENCDDSLERSDDTLRRSFRRSLSLGHGVYRIEDESRDEINFVQRC